MGANRARDEPRRGSHVNQGFTAPRCTAKVVSNALPCRAFFLGVAPRYAPPPIGIGRASPSRSIASSLHGAAMRRAFLSVVLLLLAGVATFQVTRRLGRRADPAPSNESAAAGTAGKNAAGTDAKNAAGERPMPDAAVKDSMDASAESKAQAPVSADSSSSADAPAATSNPPLSAVQSLDAGARESRPSKP